MGKETTSGFSIKNGGALDPVTPDWSSVRLSPGYGLAAPQPLQNSSFCRSKWRACRSEVAGAGKEGEGKGGRERKAGRGGGGSPEQEGSWAPVPPWAWSLPTEEQGSPGPQDPDSQHPDLNLQQPLKRQPS